MDAEEKDILIASLEEQLRNEKEKKKAKRDFSSLKSFFLALGALLLFGSPIIVSVITVYYDNAEKRMAEAVFAKQGIRTSRIKKEGLLCGLPDGLIFSVQHHCSDVNLGKFCWTKICCNTAECKTLQNQEITKEKVYKDDPRGTEDSGD